MYLEWTLHGRQRAKERFGIQDGKLIEPSILQAFPRHERWWEHDPRTEYDGHSPRGATLNLVVHISWRDAPVCVILRPCDTDPRRYWIVSLITHDHYMNNRQRRWRRSRDSITVHGNREPVRQYPFAKLPGAKGGK